MMYWVGSIVASIVAAGGAWYFLPRPFVVRSTHQAVVFRRGQPILKEVGLHWYWPVWSDVEEYPVVSTTLDLPPQKLTTADGKSVMVSCTCIYEVTNLATAVTSCYNFETDTRNAARGAVKQVIARSTLEELRTQQESVDNELGKKIRVKLKRYGLHVQEAFLSDCAPCRVICLVNETAQTEVANGVE